MTVKIDQDEVFIVKIYYISYIYYIYITTQILHTYTTVYSSEIFTAINPIIPKLCSLGKGLFI